MKKKIIILALSLFMIATAVSASSLNGDYKGNPIVKLKSNGAVVDTGDVPAMIYDGSTLVPIAALRNLGAEVTWDPNTYSVNVSLSKKYSIEDSLKELKKSNVSRIELSINDDGKTFLTYTYTGTDEYLLNHNSDFNAMLFNSSESNADNTAIVSSDSVYFSVPTNAVKDFFNGKITSEQLTSYYYKYDLKQVSTVPNNTNTSQQPVTTIVIPATPPTTTNQQPTTTTQEYICQNMRDQYVLDKTALKRNTDPFSGRSSYAMDTFERETDKTFAQFGCTKP